MIEKVDMIKDKTCYSISALMQSAVQAYCDIFDEFCINLLNAFIKESPQISLDLEEKEDVK